MSEKRFSWKTEKLQHLNEEVIIVVDNENKEWKGHILNIVDKLNEQDEQIKQSEKWSAIVKQLKKENEQLKKQRYDLYMDIARLVKENEQLRLELETHKHPLWSTREAERKINKLSDSLADEVKKNGLLNEEINRLRIENMRLKKKVVMVYE